MHIRLSKVQCICPPDGHMLQHRESESTFRWSYIVTLVKAKVQHYIHTYILQCLRREYDNIVCL